LNTRRQILRAASLMGISAMAAVGSVAVAQSRTASVVRPRIYMVTWRGKTEVERGFTQYWNRSRREAEWIWQDAGQSPARLAEIAEDIVRVKPDLVYTWGTPATLGIAGAADNPHAIIAKQIPLVFALVADPVAAGITRSRIDHGRHLSGVTHVAPLTAQFEAMRAYRPVKSVGIIYNKLEPNSATNVAAWQALGVAEKFAVWTEHFPLDANNQLRPSNPETNRALVARLVERGAEWLYLGPDTHLFTQLASIAQAATASRMLSFAAVDSMLSTDAPVLSGLVSPFEQVGQFAAYKAQQLLAGERNIAIEALKRLSYVVRLDTAKKLEAYPPMALIDYATFRTGREGGQTR
jgi:putative tryptophan/tyrosine transport system substrate-binding protein